jgi:hypothetical protein
VRRRHHRIVGGSVERLGVDNQPYLGGQRTITTADMTGGNPGSWGLAKLLQCIAFNKGETFTLPGRGVAAL